MAIGAAVVLVAAFYYFGNKYGVGTLVPPKTV